MNIDSCCDVFETVLLPSITFLFSLFASCIIICYGRNSGNSQDQYMYYLAVILLLLYWWSYYLITRGPVYLAIPADEAYTSQQVKVYHLPCHETKSNGCRRFCRKCRAYKPDRTHHCISCRRCVLKYDHHCPFLGVCVGYTTQKTFLHYLLWFGLTLIVGSYSIYNPMFADNLFIALLGACSTSCLLNFVSHAFFGLGIALFIFFLLTFTIYATGFTIFETIYQYGSKPFGISRPNYDLGILNNLSILFGFDLAELYGVTSLDLLNANWWYYNVFPFTPMPLPEQELFAFPTRDRIKRSSITLDVGDRKWKIN